MRGRRLETNKIRVGMRGCQFFITIPIQLARTAGIKKGDVVSFQFQREGQFLVYKNEEV